MRPQKSAPRFGSYCLATSGNALGTSDTPSIGSTTSWLARPSGGSLPGACAFPPRAVEFVETKYGKPRLAPVHEAADVEFNLSHSGIIALFAFTRGRAVGVNVELIREVPDVDDLAECFFSVTETALLRALPVDRRSLAFLACWTRKEAFIKALGLGLSCPPRCVRCDYRPPMPQLGSPGSKSASIRLPTGQCKGSHHIKLT
jgi:phosphopantetheinyl transferase